MTSPQAQQSRKLDPKSNAILAKLSLEDYDAVMAKATVVNLKFRKRIYQQDGAIDAIYFPITSNGIPDCEYETQGTDGDGHHRKGGG